MGGNCFEFEGKIRNDFSIKLPYLNSCIVPFVSCLDSRSIRGDFVEFWFQRFLSIYIPFQTWKGIYLEHSIQELCSLIRLQFGGFATRRKDLLKGFD